MTLLDLDIPVGIWKPSLSIPTDSSFHSTDEIGKDLPMPRRTIAITNTGSGSDSGVSDLGVDGVDDDGITPKGQQVAQRFHIPGITGPSMWSTIDNEAWHHPERVIRCTNPVGDALTHLSSRSAPVGMYCATSGMGTVPEAALDSDCSSDSSSLSSSPFSSCSFGVSKSERGSRSLHHRTMGMAAQPSSIGSVSLHSRRSLPIPKGDDRFKTDQQFSSSTLPPKKKQKKQKKQKKVKKSKKSPKTSKRTACGEGDLPKNNSGSNASDSGITEVNTPALPIVPSLPSSIFASTHNQEQIQQVASDMYAATALLQRARARTLSVATVPTASVTTEHGCGVDVKTRTTEMNGRYDDDDDADDNGSDDADIDSTTDLEGVPLRSFLKTQEERQVSFRTFSSNLLRSIDGDVGYLQENFGPRAIEGIRSHSRPALPKSRSLAMGWQHDDDNQDQTEEETLAKQGEKKAERIKKRQNRKRLQRSRTG